MRFLVIKNSLFLTLQDLQGDIIKDKHQQVFGQQIDLLIIDETHFGARADKYGQVLKDPVFKGEKCHKKMLMIILKRMMQKKQ